MGSSAPEPVRLLPWFVGTCAHRDEEEMRPRSRCSLGCRGRRLRWYENDARGVPTFGETLTFHRYPEGALVRDLERPTPWVESTAQEKRVQCAQAGECHHVRVLSLLPSVKCRVSHVRCTCVSLCHAGAAHARRRHMGTTLTEIVRRAWPLVQGGRDTWQHTMSMDIGMGLDKG